MSDLFLATEEKVGASCMQLAAKSAGLYLEALLSKSAVEQEVEIEKINRVNVESKDPTDPVELVVIIVTKAIKEAAGPAIDDVTSLPVLDCIKLALLILSDRFHYDW